MLWEYYNDVISMLHGKEPILRLLRHAARHDGTKIYLYLVDRMRGKDKCRMIVIYP